MSRKRKEKFKVVYETETKHLFSSNAKGKYRLTYKIGKVTSKLPHTKGIFIFDTLEQAKTFIDHNYSSRYRILKVLPIGRKSRSIYHTTISEAKILDLFYKSIRYKKYFSSTPILGTSCYPKVEVKEML